MFELNQNKDQWKAARLLYKLNKQNKIQPFEWLEIPNKVIKKYFIVMNQNER